MMLQSVMFVCVLEGVGGVVGVRLEVECPCPTVCNVTPHHWFSLAL